MLRRHLLRVGSLTGVLVLAGTVPGCAKPRPPKLKPKAVAVKTVTADGLEIEVTIDAKNPNSIPLVARSVKAHVTLAEKVDMGEVTVKTKVKLPAEKHKDIVVPMSLKWGNSVEVAMLAATRETIPFKVEGTAEVGADDFSVDVPFTSEGELTRQDLVVLTARSLPIPKL